MAFFDKIRTTYAYNPQSWNLYSYVNGNPVNYNDPLGHYGAFAGRSPKPVYMFQMSGADWVNWGAMGSFYSNLYGGNIVLGGGSVGGGGSQSGYWKPIYRQTVETSSDVVWDPVLGAYVGGEMIVTSVVVGIQWVEGGGGGGSEAIGALQELGQVIGLGLKNYGNLNFTNYGLKTIGRFVGMSRNEDGCWNYAVDFKDLIKKNMNLNYWDIEIWERIYPGIHFSVVLKSKETDLRIWLDFYSMPAVAPFALPNSRFNFIYGLPFPPLGSIYIREE